MKLLMIYSDENGESRTAMFENIPFEDVANVNLDELISTRRDWNDGSTTVFVELADDADPMVVDRHGDEVRREFVTL